MNVPCIDVLTLIEESRIEDEPHCICMSTNGGSPDSSAQETLMDGGFAEDEILGELILKARSGGGKNDKLTLSPRINHRKGEEDTCDVQEYQNSSSRRRHHNLEENECLV